VKQAAADVLRTAEAGAVPDETLTDALVLHSTFGEGFGIDATSLQAIDEALGLVTSAACRTRLLAAAAYHHAAWGSSLATSMDAVQWAEAAMPPSCPPTTIAELRFAESLALLAAPSLERRAALADEVLAIGRDESSWFHIARGLRLRSLVEMSAGRLRDLDGTLDELLAVADQSGSWICWSDGWRWRTAVEIARGDDDAALAGCDELERIGASPFAGRGFVGTQRILLAWATGDLDLALTQLDGLLSVLPDDAALAPDRPVIALTRLGVLADMGSLDAARGEVEDLLRDRSFDAITCRRYTGELALMARLAADLGVHDVAEAVLPRLEPFAGQLLVLSWGEGILGATDRYIGALRSLLSGSVDDASFDRACAVEQAAGVHVEVARSEQARARARG
jgi:hypothetical protein